MEAAHNNTDGPDKREQLRMEFYATYDVMTGIRIAATLGGFFGLMVFLVIYKSRSKSVKALKDPKIVEIAAAAVAEEEAEEEERQLAYALEAALGARCSLGLGGPWAPWPARRAPPRFSSVGGYSSLLAPPRRLTKLRGDSLPASALRFDCHPAFYEDDVELTDAIDDSLGAGPSEYVNRFLAVPGGPRRYSNITCSSSGSSYLERRGSSIVCALPALPPTPRAPRAPRCRPARRYTAHDSDCLDVCNPIDIQVIQATPELSPCVSEHTILDGKPSKGERLEPGGGAGAARLAPLASLGSCGVSLSVDYQDCDLHSVGSDSVFLDEDECVDTDDEVEQFSTDSDDSATYKSRGYTGEECRELRPRRRSRHIVGRSVPVAASPPLSRGSRSPLVRRSPALLARPAGRRALRRLSHPTVLGRQSCSTISGAVAAISEEPASEGRARRKRRFPGLPFQAPELGRSRSQDVELGGPPAGAGPAAFSCPSPPPLNPEHCSWSRETLF